VPDGEYLEPYELFNQGFTVNQAQMDNRGGYSTYYSRYLDQDQNVTILRIYRESFDQIGRLLAGVRCVFDVFDRTPENCDENALETIGPEGSSITDSIHYFAPGEFDSLVAIQDAIRWTVEGVPTDTRGIAVISAQSQSDLSTSEVLCRGVQDDKEETYLFCMATDEQLDNTVVVEVNKGMLTKIIPGAKLVQIQ